jgi:hypothetical protein
MSFDRVYAQLGVADDATQQPHPIALDYRKPAIAVLLDVLRNLKGRNRQPEDLPEHELLEFLRGNLGVSRIDLAIYVADMALGAERHFMIFANVCAPNCYFTIYQQRCSARTWRRRGAVDLFRCSGF